MKFWNLRELLVAAIYTLKRVESINKSSEALASLASIDVSAAQDGLENAKILLEGMPKLMEQGNVLDAAYNLAKGKEAYE